MQGQIDIPLDIVGRWQADQSAYELAKTYYWAKVAHIADHNDELAQPAYEGAYLADLNEINDAPAASRRMVVVSSDLFRAQQTAHAIADLLGLDVALDPRLRERSFGEWEGMTREEILEQYADDYHSWRAHTGGETKHGVESRRHTGQRGSQAIRSIIAEHADDPTATTLLAVGHGSWIVATVAVLLDMDPDDLNNLGAMRNAFWTSMSVNTGGSNGPADPDTWQWKLDAFNQGPAIAALTDWENGPKELRGPNMPLWKPIVQ
ncbi:histidine phosphatase family protein [Bifidobacterium pseudocatenulatum]|uniref:Histidine phosphatase family protein n=1 Tax=Bifidobacterium pseudocatenulatum TaxID=28026 RepID=A0A413KBR7_BIFPS|nr:histidine phosphatase family protein [Bifidobacterium pseudocatenulatum]HJI75933.1 histidine phosphatase family protein [Bifidobacteriaceae bacterium]MBS6745674.1 histidine phosphatase family protein [Bifidobacterium pseudocatenulatum]MCB4864301.1 histidine phosphatase family protein [Bifidobacterium pseudocatenulatum]MCB4866188.1 histidine phosphatase family protein [Bifidobacterium pseudocatenulatum]MCB4869611.1 histidine phosphatase family protein [Bifidobacterium pseudocatenulatum]